MCYEESFDGSDVYEHSYKNYKEYYKNYANDDCDNPMQKGSRSVFPETVYYGNAYIPFQQWYGKIYSPEESLCAGTVFPELDQPYEKGGHKI